MSYQHIKIPAEGQAITANEDLSLNVPDNPVIPFIEGDGIGPDIWAASVRVFDAAVAAAYGGEREINWYEIYAGEKANEVYGPNTWLPEDTTNAILDYRVAIKGPLTTPVGGGIRSINVRLRQVLDLYACVRPVRWYEGVPSPMKEPGKLDVVIFRENTEGSYLGLGTSSDVGTPREEQVAHEIHSAAKVERILRAGMQWASEHEKHRITIADKSNAIPAHHLWRRVGEEVAADFSQLEVEYRYVDALAMELVRDPARFDVIITSNLFGDILSDLGAQLVGGLGVAASANLHPGRAGLFEPVHGSAPPLVGTGQANPVGAIITGALLLRDLGCTHGAQLLEDGVCASIQAGVATPDLGGGATTNEVSHWIGRWIGDKEGG